MKDDLLELDNNQTTACDGFIHRLPDSVLEQILSILLGNIFHFNLLSILHCLASVCRRWHNVIHGASRFWGIIDASRGVTVMQHLIKKSLDAPLYIHSTEPLLCDIVPAIEGELYRCRSLVVRVHETYYPNMLQSIQHSDIRMLESLSLTCLDTARHECSHEFRSTLIAPRLRSLTLWCNYSPLHRINIVGPALTNLHIRNGSQFDPETHRRYIDILIQCPQLVEVDFRGAVMTFPQEPTSAAEATSKRVARLSNLRKLRILFFPETICRAICSAIQAPSCRQLVLHTQRMINISAVPADSLMSTLLSSCRVLKLIPFSLVGAAMFVNLDRDSGGTPTMPQLRVSAHNTPWDGIERMVERIDPVELIGSGQGVINLLQNPDNLRKFDAFAKLTLEMDGQDISGILNALGSTNGSSGDRPCPKLTDILIIDANCLQPALIAFAEGRFAQGGSSISFSYIVKRRHCGPHFDKWMWRQVEEKFELANFVGKFSYELHYDDEEIQPVTDMLVPDAM